MKKSILLVIYSLIIIHLSAQEHSNCDSVYLKTKTEIKNDDPCLMTAVNYVLEHPLEGNPPIYMTYMKFVFNWMEKATITFTLNEHVMELCKNDNLPLFNVYLASLAKAAIEAKKVDVPSALKLFVIYLEKPENKVKRTSKVKRLIEDVKKNKLEKYL